MSVSCFVRKGVVYRPIWAKDTNGLYIAVEPVAVVPVSDTEGLRRAFRDAAERGTPVIPAVPWKQVEPVVFKRAGVKNQSEFQRGGTFPVDIEERNGLYRVIVQRRRRLYQGWENDPDQTYDLPPGSTLDDAIERAIQLIQEKSRAQSAGT
jgi:hypothetical protein